MPARTRSHNKVLVFSSSSSSSLLLDLPDAIIMHVLVRVPSDGLKALACASRDLHHEHVPAALPERASVVLGQRLCVRPGENPLAALRFAELRAARTTCTIAADTCHTVAIGDDGGVWAWGGHEQGPDEEAIGDEEEAADADGAPEEPPCFLSHLGLGRTAGPCVTRPARVSGLPVGLVVLEVAAGYEHTLLRCASGRVWSCGVGEHGRLGHGSVDSCSRPRRIEALEHVSLVAAGGFQSLALTDDGTAYSWGWGESGSTGHGTRAHCFVPTAIAALAETRIVQASAGSGHALFVGEFGELYACGDFRFGKLGLGKLTEDVTTPTRVELPKGRRVRQASAWHAHSLAVSTTGELYSFGCGECGRLGHGHERCLWRPNLVKFFRRTKVRWAAAGELHSCVLTEKGQVFCFGDSTLGQGGSFDVDHLLKPTLVSSLAHTTIDELAVGDHHTLVRTADRALLAFGKNLEGQLGLGRARACVAEPSTVRWADDK